MPRYTLILPDGQRREITYKMKDCPVMQQVRLNQMAYRLGRLVSQGVITDNKRRHLWGKIKASINQHFTPAHAGRGHRSPPHGAEDKP